MGNVKIFNQIRPIYFDPPLIAQDEVFVPLSYSNIKDYYIISNYGRIYNIYLNSFINPTKGINGYIECKLPVCNYHNRQRGFRIHRLVMLTFCYFPGCENFEVNHKDGNKSNNYIGNLEWSTRKENIDHSWKYGLSKAHPCIGEQNGRAKLKEEDVHLICQKLVNNQTTVSISKEFNISRSVISGIKNKNIWVHISSNYNL